MADYDASVRVNTKVDNSDLKRLQKDFDDLNKKLEGYKQSLKKLEAKGFDKHSKTWQMIKRDIKSTENALEDVKNRIKEVNATALTNGFEKIESTSKKCFKSIQNGAKKTNGLFAVLGSRIKGIALSLLIFNWITKGFNAMVNAMKEGFHNLAQYSDEYNASMSALKSQTEQLKNGLATAFEPIVNMIIPYLTKFVEWLNTATDAMAQFLAAMQGKSIYTRAKKQVLDYAKSLDTATKSAKGALASFDQLNVLSKNDSNVNTGSGLSRADAFEEAEINPEIYAMLERVKALLEVIKPLVIAIGFALLAWKIANFLKDLGSVAANLWDAYWIILLIAGLALSVYEYFSMWKDGVDWEGIIGYITGVAIAVLALYILLGPFVAGIGLLIFGIAGLVLAFKDMTENGFTAENMTLALISAVLILAGVFIVFGATAALVVGAVMAVIGVLAAIVIWAGNGEEALNRLQNQFSLFGSFLKNVFTGDFEAAFNDIQYFALECLNQGKILTESIINYVIKGLNWLIEKINTAFGSDIKLIPEVSIPRIDIPERVNIPELVNDTVIQGVIQGGKPFATILGNQPAGQTDIKTLLSTMVDEFKQAMPKTDGGGEYTFVAQIDGETIFREAVKQNQMYQKATGRSAFSY